MSFHLMLSEAGLGVFVLLRTSEDGCNINSYKAHVVLNTF